MPEYKEEMFVKECLFYMGDLFIREETKSE